MSRDPPLQSRIDALYRRESGKVLATLVKVLGDFDLAEDAMQEAFAAALKSWETKGVPKKPVEWLISAGRFKAIDAIRRRAKLNELEPELSRRIHEIEEANLSPGDRDIKDDRLRLIFTCCHPAIGQAQGCASRFEEGVEPGQTAARTQVSAKRLEDLDTLLTESSERP